MANISNFSSDRPDYRVFTYDSTGRIVKVDVWRTEADYLARTVGTTNKIQTIVNTYDAQCRLLNIETTFGLNLESTITVPVVRRTTNTEMTYGGSKVLTKETTSS